MSENVKVKEDFVLSESNKKAYSKDSIDNERQIEINYPDGKTKFVKETTFKNGVKKRKVVGMKKGERIIFDKGVNWS